MATGTATIDFGAGAAEVVTAVSSAGITSTSPVGVGLRSEATTNNSVDDIYIDPIDVVPVLITAGVGFSIQANARNGKAFGQYKIDWAY